MQEHLVRVEDLAVRYGDRAALAGVSFRVAAGEIVALLGPNGAGKTTTLSVLATLRRPDSGRAEIAGCDVVAACHAARRALGLVPQRLAVYPTLTARENLLFFAGVAGLRGARARTAAATALEMVGLDDRAGDPVATFSGGMQRRLNLACGLLHAPRVLLLDEPTVGVDPQSRERIFDAVRAQAAAGTAVVYSTHAMDEAERLCERVVLIDQGRLIADGTPAELVRRSGVALRLELVTREPLPPGWADGLEGVVPGPVDAGEPVDAAPGPRTHIRLDHPADAARALARAAARGGEILDFSLHRPDLQDVFLELTGRHLRD
jgi:ABC-2 type transport system ATP-binding protein